MKKTMTKIFALVLVLAMVIGFIAMIPAQAAELNSVQFMAHNVYFDEYLQIMYAVYVPEGTTVQKIVLSDGAKEFAAVPFVDEEGNAVTANVGGVACSTYVAANGVALQNIDTVVHAEAYVNGAVVAEDDYSILQYLHKRLVVDNEEDANKVAMYKSLLDVAEKMQTVINGSVTLHGSSYVSVVNGTIDGSKADGMVAVGTTLSGITTDLIPGENQEIVWTVTEYTDAGVAGVSATKTDEEVKALTIENGVNLILEAGLKDAEAAESGYFQVTDLANLTSGEYIIAVNNNGTWQALGNTFGSKIAATELSVSDGKVQNADTDGLVLTITVTGTTANISNGSNYLGYGSSGTNLTQPTTAYNWTIAEGGTAGTFMLNATTGSNRVVAYQTSGNQFGGYSTTNTSGYIFDFGFFKLSDGTVVEPEVTEPSEAPTEPEVTEPSEAPTEPSVEPTEPEVTEPVVAEPTTVEMNIYGTTGTLASDSSSISWTSTDGNVTFTNVKGGTAIRTSDSTHYRVYANSTVKIAATGMTQVTITCVSGYTDEFEAALTTAGYTYTTSGLVITITLDGVDEISFKPTAQARLSDISVTYQK